MDGSIFSSASSFSPPSVVIFVRCRRRRQNLKLWIIGFGLEKGALLFVGGLWNWKSPPHLLSSDSFPLQSRSDGPTGDTTARGGKCWKEFAMQPLPGNTEVLHKSDTDRSSESLASFPKKCMRIVVALPNSQGVTVCEDVYKAFFFVAVIVV